MQTEEHSTETVPQHSRISPQMKRLSRWLPLGLLLLFFILAGLAFIPLLGVQQDEALFVPPMFHQDEGLIASGISIKGRRIPLMLMSYVGAFKSWLYYPIYALWPPSLYSLRVPVLLAGCGVLLLFYVLLSRYVSRRAALVGTALLATDPLFLLTTVFDWGPAALQPLLLLAGLVFWTKHFRQNSLPSLAAGSFLFGLALWNKFLFGWTLAGLALAMCCVYLKQVLRLLNRKTLACGLLFFALGCAPLLFYNIVQGGSTVASNVSLRGESLLDKAQRLPSSLDGSALFGYLVRDSSPFSPAISPNSLAGLSSRMAAAIGNRQHSWLLWAFLLALVLLPLLWRSPARTPAAFLLLTLAGTWLLMAMTKGGGESAHHIVLLWPLPHALIGCVLAETTRRWGRVGLLALGVITACLAMSQVLVLNQYYLYAVRYGSGSSWSDAVSGLAQELDRHAANQVYSTDWGIYGAPMAINPRLPVIWNGQDGPESVVENHWNLFAGHVAGEEIMPGGTERLHKAARQRGLEKVTLAILQDRHHRPVFEVFRFASPTFTGPVSSHGTHSESAITVRFQPSQVRPGQSYTVQVKEYAGQTIDVAIRTISGTRIEQATVRAWCALDAQGRATLGVPPDYSHGAVFIEMIRTADQQWKAAKGSLTIVP